MICSDSWSNTGHEHSAHASAVTVVGHLDVAVVSPGCAPGVLDEEVGLSVVSAVSDSEHTVVELGSTAGGVVEDTALVELEGHLVGLNGDGGGSSLDGGLHGGGRVGLDVDVAGVVSDTGNGGVAGSISGLVWVVGLEISLVGLVPLECALHGATRASHGSVVVAINELLLGEGLEGSVRDEVGTLKSAGGREGPAGSALALVLHWGDCSRGDPVDLIGGGGVVFDGTALGGEGLEASEAVELAGVPGGELVMGEGVGVGGVGVDSLNLGVNLGEDLLSGVELLNGGP